MMQFLMPGFIQQKDTHGISLLVNLVREEVYLQQFLLLFGFPVADEKEVKKEKPKDEPSSHFQRQRVDMLLGELVRKFPVPQALPQEQVNKTDQEEKSTGANKNDVTTTAVTVKQEPMDTNTNDSGMIQIKQEPSSGVPPEKKLKLN